MRYFPVKCNFDQTKSQNVQKLANWWMLFGALHFEAWAKLAQQWLVCVPLGMHLEPINRVNVVSDNK